MTRRSGHVPDSPGLPVVDIPGIDRSWSRVVVASDAEGTPRSWHVLDTGPLLAARGEQVRATLLCVHGNPTWSYLWRRVLEAAPPGWRVIAVDQLGMGFSERPVQPRGLAARIEELVRLTSALEVSGPIFSLAHDWGGPISLGWALRHLDDLRGVVLTNTAVHQPEDSAGPAVIRLARLPGLVDWVCQQTPTFVRATTALSVPPLPRPVHQAFAQPYLAPDRRAAVADFVRDIPFETDHPSRAALDAVADGLGSLSQVPALLVWGARDPVFGERYLQDLLDRLPHADVQRYPSASHLVLEDRPEGIGVIWQWLRSQLGEDPHADAAGSDPAPAPEVARVPIAVSLSSPSHTAVVELVGDGRSVTFAQLSARVHDVARGLAARGVRPGDRVAVLVPPGIELTTLVYAVWRLGAVVVVADAGLGLGRLGAALRSAGPKLVLGISKALTLAAVTRVHAERVLVTESGTELDALALVGRGLGGSAALLPEESDLPGSIDGAVLFTSGATGPPKGVVYTRDQLSAQVALLRDTFSLGPGERFVAAFAPFALYGPALGLTSVVPDMDVTAPHTLTARRLAQAVEAIDATAVFAAPAALRNVVDTAGDLDAHERGVLEGPRLVLSAGAPVSVHLLRSVQALLPSATTHTPYGMTEALPIATLDPTALSPTQASGQSGVCVGHPVPGAEVGIALLDGRGIPAEDLITTPGMVGEIVVRGAHVKDRYDRQWAQQRASDRPAGWHRTGDVGHFDGEGRLWVEGRLAHVVTTPEGPVTPYPVEDLIRTVPGVSDAAIVGVGPAGTQQLIAVVVPEGRLGPLACRMSTGTPRGAGVLAPPRIARAVRQAASGASPVPVAAVLVRDWLPVDIRHASKVDRGSLSGWADAVLHGRGVAAAVRAALRPGAPHTKSR
ncbi:MAG: alpha/beta fold hydrolase [Ornithinimicrobium sp.]|uniref:alpha/beta fold hydrolase n=1 Tax=Ornithinimicrobium sp. TaxID=1977084 RepID=UPI0026DFC815|nr:alpha/beta fold hydrolase [Ornithinimicrobium sp.]MDO5740773.1 alpha/beta fold hydrolase [Ornithinimicrobium sp.]